MIYPLPFFISISYLFMIQKKKPIQKVEESSENQLAQYIQQH